MDAGLATLFTRMKSISERNRLVLDQASEVSKHFSELLKANNAARINARLLLIRTSRDERMVKS